MVATVAAKVCADAGGSLPVQEGGRKIVAVVSHQWQILHQELHNLLAVANKLELAVLRAAATQPPPGHPHAAEEVIPKLQLDRLQVDYRKRVLCVLAEKLCHCATRLRSISGWSSAVGGGRVLLALVAHPPRPNCR